MYLYGGFMKIDTGTIALVLIISNFIQAVLIFSQSSLNKNYRGVILFATGSSIYAAAYLLILMQGIISIPLLTVVLGNLLLLLAIIFQYTGLMRFLELKVYKWFVVSIFAACLLLFIYFEYIDNNITLRLLL